MTDESKKSPTDYMKEEPFISLSLQAYKIRRNMLFCAILCGFQAYYSGLGGRFVVLSQNLDFPKMDFNILLLLISLYFTIYFSILGWENLTKWRLRSTGFANSKVKSMAGMGFAREGANGIPANDDNIATSQTTAWQNIDPVFSEIKTVLNNFENKYLKEGSSSDFSKDDIQLQTCTELINKITIGLESLEETSSKNLLAFDNNFWTFQNTSKFNFYILEFGGPIVFSLFLMIALFCRTVYEQFI
ncbi:MAG: hypothetical protein CL942_09765 [Desulfovibrio sp.]|nr:hypothetical protein [Desulfovibrio sp.]